MTLSSSVHNEVRPKALRRSVGPVEFVSAESADDQAIREFLKGQSMDGPMRLEMCTEPSFMQAMAMLGDTAEVLVAKDRNTEKIVGVGARVLRRMQLNGKELRGGYLAFLRMAPQFRGRRDFLRTGYAALGALQRATPADFHFTSILQENHAARRLLEANLKGLPEYQPFTDVVTFTFGAGDRRLACRPAHAPRHADGVAESSERAARAAFLAQHFRSTALAPCMDAANFDSPVRGALRPEDFAVVLEGGNISATAALWDQRDVRQLIVSGYSPALRFGRGIYNVWRTLRGRPRLPACGSPLNMAYISHLAVLPGQPNAFRQLLTLLAAEARRRGIDYLVLSLAASHPLCPVAAALAGHRIESTLYRVRWPGDPDVELSGIPHVEAGLL